MKVKNFIIDGQRTFVIAEIGNNHNGSVERAIQLVDLARDAGADCVKFQMRHLQDLYRKRSLDKEADDLGSEYILDLLDRFELSVDEHRKVRDYCTEKGVLYMCTPWDQLSLEVLESFDVSAYKLASADLTNLPLIEKIADTGKPMVLSTGMSTTQEIIWVAEYLQSRDADFALLHCNSTYPAPFEDINLNWMHTLKKVHPLIGYSGHERGVAVTMAAVALGASIVERHFTLDRTMEGPDHAASLEPEEFSRLVEGIRQVDAALGEETHERKLSQGEMINRENLAKSLVASLDLKKDTVIKAEHIKVCSPGQGLSPLKAPMLLGKRLQRDIAEEDFFYESDLNEEAVLFRDYQFQLKWGIPVRYHDFSAYMERLAPDFIEFHLSYSDMELKISDFIKGKQLVEFVVHAPELFANSHLMDLTTPDAQYRAQSLRETQKVIDITRELNRYFPKTQKPLIVANVGGFSMDEPLAKESLESYYTQLGESLAQLDTDGIEIIPQTTAPFPWHFGGQRYQNLFLHAEEIQYWCEQLNIRMCFDVSHSFLACNYFKVDFYDFCRKVAPYSAHFHISDGQGTNGEGIQVGTGEIDFQRLGKILVEAAPGRTFLPEIWQGHKNNGEGFRVALERLEGFL